MGGRRRRGVIKDLRGTPYSLSPISSEYIVCPFLVCLPLQIFDSVIKDLRGTPYSLSRGAGAGNSCDQLQSVTVSYYQLLLPRSHEALARTSDAISCNQLLSVIIASYSRGAGEGQRTSQQPLASSNGCQFLESCMVQVTLQLMRNPAKLRY
jgi:hypothetical protein